MGMKEEKEVARRVQSLSDVFAAVPDPRSALGKRYPLPAVLNLAVAAMLCGHDNPNQIATYGQNQSPTFLRILGFPRGEAPGKSTLYDLFSRMDEIAFEERLGEWAEQVLVELMEGNEEPIGIALDGKTLRGSAKQGAAIHHLLSAVSHQLGIALYQLSVDEKTNEIPLAPLLLANLLIKGRVFTMDALLTQRDIARYIVEEGGDYFMIVKRNQETLAADIAIEMEDFSP
jgi:hypothetical protein